MQQEGQAQTSSGNQPPVVPPKTFAEDSNLAPIEEEKKEMEETKVNAPAQQEQEPQAQQAAVEQDKASLWKSFTGLFSKKKPEGP